MTDKHVSIAIDTAASAPRHTVQRCEHDAMACTFGVHIVGEDPKYARQAAEAALAELDRIEQELSRFIAGSDVARLNAAAPGEPIRVSLDTIECLQLAAELFRDTGGAFDVTFRSRKVGDPKQELPPLVLDPHNHAVGVQRAGVVVDLGGLGKGYALDRMAAVLREWSITAALIHSGQSTVYALGRPRGQNGWRVGLRDPADAARILATVELCDRALSGSGQHLHGRHIIDPRSGRPARDDRAAWSLAPTAAVADALSTAFMILSPDEAHALCGRRADVSAILALRGQALVCCGAPCRLHEAD